MQTLNELEEELREISGDDYYDYNSVDIEEYSMDDFGCAQITLKGEFVNVDGVRAHLMGSDDWYCASCSFQSSTGELRFVIDKTKKNRIESGEMEA